jgi:hypothetical protein
VIYEVLHRLAHILPYRTILRARDNKLGRESGKKSSGQSACGVGGDECSTHSGRGGKDSTATSSKCEVSIYAGRSQWAWGGGWEWPRCAMVSAEEPEMRQGARRASQAGGRAAGWVLWVGFAANRARKLR